MEKAILHFKSVDPVLAQLAEIVGPWESYYSQDPKDYFANLTRTIVGQQLSTKVATTIYSRFKNLFPNQEVTPKKLLEIKDTELRSIGLSNSKVSYVKNLALAVVEGQLDLKTINQKTDAEVINELVKVKGIGPWSAEMFLMFSLGREDVFSHGDLGLKTAIGRLYSLENPTREEIEKIISKWSPYKTYGCLILWKSLDTA